ncbi:Na(+)/H(+) exchanger beta-like isoform X2 [Mytilus californianus]|uniref:Na(+)/H(+) exchanger beta-like isoform X2 n=2 Tax=Mytilus californianus TaxID=6549 RepID=UPI0022482938|nr:Na(+)/H(+) exchanger beta-like isoform X2 [Mytilus californianus]
MKGFCLLILLCYDHAATSVVHTTLNQNNDTKSNGHMVYDPHNQTSHDNKSHEHGNKTGHKDSHTGHGAGHGIHLFSINYDHVAQPLLITVFLFAAGISKLGFHHADFLSSRVPESCLLIILGIIVGAILKNFTNPDDMPGMSSELFFLYLLPPIILESAWSLHDRTFFDNVGTVLIYAVIGTVLNCFLIGPTLYGLVNSGAMGDISIEMIECLVFSSIIVAVDPVAVLAIFQEIGVNNVLYFLVFGESLLNDAVTVVIYNMMKTFNLMKPEIPVSEVFLGIVSFFVVSFGGIAIGVVFGMITAVITKYTEHVRVIEPLSVFVLAYMSYLMAELFHFSGIISLIACGLTQAQYAFHNISTKSHTTVKYFSKMQSSISDCIIFVFLGIALFKKGMFERENWNPWFIIWTLVLCLLYRFLVVFLLTYFVNKSNRVRRIGKDEQFIMAYGGLRGAVAFSLMDLLKAKNLPKEMFTTTLMVLIFFTVFVQGITIKPLVKLLRVKLQSTDKITIGEEINSHVTDHVMAGIEEVLGRRGEHHFREILEFYNSKYLKNWLQRNPTSTDEHIMSLYEKIALQQHFESLAGSRMVQEKYVSEDNLPLIPEEITNQIIEEEEEDEVGEDDEGSEEDLVLPPITIRSPSIAHPVPPLPMPPPEFSSQSPMPSPSVLPIMQPEMFDDWIDRKLAEQRDEDRKNLEKVGRRKSLFPQFKKKEHQKDMEPTAKDVRKLMAPSRRDLVHKKLDKNLKNDSSADLLKYLQEKQLRTRRMSRAVLGGGTSTPMGSQTNVSFQPRRVSIVAANAAAQNYKRRLSLAVPDRPKFQRDRSPSDFTGVKPDHNLFRGYGDASKDPDTSSPRRKRKGFKKAATLNFEPEVTPLINQNAGKSPSRISGASGRSINAIQEHEGEDSEELDTSKSSASSDSVAKKRRFRLRKSKTLCEEDKEDSSHVKRSQTDPTSETKSPTKVKFDVKSEVFSKKRKKKPMHKSKSLDQSRSSGEFSDISGAESHSSIKSDSDSRSAELRSVKSKPEDRKLDLADSNGLNVDEEHAGRKASYTQAMSNKIPEDESVELKDLKDDKKLTKQKSL